MSAPLNERRFRFREWPATFSQSRNPKEKQPFFESLGGLDPYTDGVKLFMQPYEGDRTFFQVDVVTRFCRNVCLRDLHSQISPKKTTAWLDDRQRPLSSEPVADIPLSAQGDISIAANHCGENLGRPISSLQDQCVDDGRGEISAVGNAASRTSATLRPREYAQCLSALDLYTHLRRRRFDHPGLENADRRLIYVADPDGYDILALIATAGEHQKVALRDLLWQFLDRRTSLKARIEPRGYQVFHLEAHLPCFALRTTLQADVRKRKKQKIQRDWMDLSFLAEGGEDGVMGIHQAQFSFTICGTDNSRWVAYALEANSFDPDRGDDDRCTGMRSDELAMGDLNAENPYQDPREYFLNVLSIRAGNQLMEATELVLAIEASCKNQDALGLPFLPMSGNNQSSAFDWNERMLHLLRNLIPHLSKVTKSWQRFASPGKDVEYFQDYSVYSPETRDRLDGILESIRQRFEGMEELKETLEELEEQREKLADRLGSCVARQGSQFSEFTTIIISPVVVAAGIFSIPDPFISYERNLVSFFLTIAIGMVSVYVLLILKGGWHRRQPWLEKLSWRAKAAWYGDPALTVENEAGARVLKRRSTHAGFGDEV